jgi:hypothetical protein
MRRARAAIIGLILPYFSMSPIPAISDWGDYLVTSNDVEVLEGPDNGFPARTTLEEGRLVVELDRLRGFVQVRIPAKSHLSGWIKRDSLSLVRKWEDALGYPEGHPAAEGGSRHKASGEEQSPPRYFESGLWSLIVVAIVAAVILFLVWWNRFNTDRSDVQVRRLWTRMLVRIRKWLCRLACGETVDITTEH